MNDEKNKRKVREQGKRSDIKNEIKLILLVSESVFTDRLRELEALSSGDCSDETSDEPAADEAG